MARVRTVGALALLLVVTACSGTTGPSGAASDTNSPSSAGTSTPTPSATPTDTPTEQTTTTTPTEQARAGTRITTDDSAFGTMLFDTKDQAIYIWEREPTATPTCYGDCAVKWPPVLTDGRPVATGGVRQHLLGTTERRDGSLQVTYNDHPLYYYADEPPGAVECHEVSTHGGLWWVVQPDGDRAA